VRARALALLRSFHIFLYLVPTPTWGGGLFNRLLFLRCSPLPLSSVTSNVTAVPRLGTSLCHRLSHSDSHVTTDQSRRVHADDGGGRMTVLMSSPFINQGDCKYVNPKWILVLLDNQSINQPQISSATLTCGPTSMNPGVGTGSQHQDPLQFENPPRDA
jgi:hypothetical protein